MRCCATAGWPKRYKRHCSSGPRDARVAAPKLEAATVKLSSVIVLLLSLVVPASAAQLYRWIDNDGRVEWRDTPPPSTARKVETRTVPGNAAATPELPYATRQAALNFPITLWTTDCGAICDAARRHLKQRGVPFAERDVKTNQETFLAASGGRREVPVLFVGRTRLVGYTEAGWDETLSAAGYPLAPAARSGSAISNN